MNLSFIPANLQLTKDKDGWYLVTLQDEEILRTRIEKKAVAKFNALRRELEAQFPARELTTEEKTKLLLKYISDSKVGLDHNSFREPEKKKKSGSTRTFG
jgi:hypothetical protein